MGVQLLLAHVQNAVRNATRSASSVRPAERTVYRQPTVRHGNGQITLSGGYTGADDAMIELEIRPPGVGATRVSQPVFAGAGNGTMTPPTALDGTPSQSVTVTLIDTGTETTHAAAVLWGDVRLRAHAAGTAGNAVSLTVSPSLTLSRQPVGALSAALSKDTAEWTDPRLDFGAAPLQPDGTVADTATRLVFARDTNRVYRHYKRWDGEQWRYGVSPKLTADYAADSLVHTVTGSYTVTVSDGTTTETYANCVTLYDALAALNGSTLVDVVSLVTRDRHPGGMAAMDLPLRTAACALPIVSSTPARMPALSSVVIAPNAPTETVTVRCTKNTPVGAETWTVESKIFSPLPEATTSVAYRGPSVDFTVPVVPLLSAPMQGRIVITQDVSVTHGENPPAVCLYRPVLGAKATAKTLTLIYQKRPATDCTCESAHVSGQPQSAWLGLHLTAQENTMVIPDWYRTRLQTLYNWRYTFIKSNTALTAKGELRTAALDLQLAEQSSALLAGCLADLYAELGDTIPAPALAEWDNGITELGADLQPLSGVGAEALSGIPEIIAGTTYEAGAVGWTRWGYRQSRMHFNSDGVPIYDYAIIWRGVKYFVCLVGGTPQTTPMLGDAQSVAGDFKLDNLSNTEVLPVEWGNSVWQEIIATEAADLLGRDAVDIDSTGSPPYDAGMARTSEAFLVRYKARMDYVKVLAGLVPKSEASSAGTACWHDPGDTHYWVIEGSAYLPIFNNVYYHACIKVDGTVTPTYEFGFALRIGCPDRLVVNDLIVISIADVSAQYPYQIGDSYAIPVLGATPLTLTGGQGGTDTLTWAVRSSLARLPDYALTLAELPYSAGGFGWAIHRGAVPFALGDQFYFDAETGGQWRWRKDGGAWSAEAALTEQAALIDGLVATFQPGIAPNFVSGDVYRWRVLQPHSPQHVATAHGETWRWSGSTATLSLTWTTDQTIRVLGLLRHGLTPPARVTLELRDGTDTIVYSVTPTLHAGPLLAVLPAPVTARSLTLRLTDADGMALGWVYAGLPFTTRRNAHLTLRRAYQMERGPETNPRGAYQGSGWGGEIRWEHGLEQAELDTLLTLIDASKADSDAPIVIVPQREHPDEAALCRIDTDTLDLSDLFDFQPRDASRRHLSVTLPLAPVLA